MARRLLRREPAQARSRALVEAIVTAFDQMLRTFGDEDEVTIERLVERAGVSIGSFYEYFTNKDGLLGTLVERATRENFDALLRDYDAHVHADITAAIDFLAIRVSGTYLAHPARTRMLLAGIGRLNWLRTITAERDRFAIELAKRAVPLLPQHSLEVLIEVMTEFCDVGMGVLVSHLYRPPRPVEAAAKQLSVLAHAILAAKSEGARRITD